MKESHSDSEQGQYVSWNKYFFFIILSIYISILVQFYFNETFVENICEMFYVTFWNWN